MVIAIGMYIIMFILCYCAFAFVVSEPSKARIVRQKPHRMSPIPKRHDIALAKTLSVGGGLG